MKMGRFKLYKCNIITKMNNSKKKKKNYKYKIKKTGKKIISL
jgi:hypothetical protein